jgi:hypothetical protein
MWHGENNKGPIIKEYGMVRLWKELLSESGDMEGSWKLMERA